ncbi:PWWP domain-containing protein 5-like [Impatiens glandulifera]|uniref:PWWP domain-containing protein 5-like n=1 Tax=Impatiens glandulifera TaxID=253017 RepID=UPI001FB10874|nr:PWWP domain-containing protein 5-like [Impatiens glandulifera]
MSSRFNNIDLNSDAVPIEQNDIGMFESEAAQTLVDQPMGNNDGDMMKFDISDQTSISELKLGQLGGNVDGGTWVGHEIKGSVESELVLEEKSIENGVKFFVNDLVWAKVRSHPWWPGQIFNPSDASEKARKHQNGNDRLLIGYFGDKSFAWNEESRVKPFHTNFFQMEKQSDLESFQHAVDCSLDEVSRRVQFGLSCLCSPEELSNKIKTQMVVNGGIKEEASIIEGMEDNRSNVDSFAPLKLIQYMKKLAEFPHEGIDRLDFVIAHSQLLAFNSWKGYYDLPEFKTFEAWLDKDEGVQGNGSMKRKGKMDSDVRMLKKEKLTSDLIYENSSNSQKMKDEKTSMSLKSKKQFSRLGESTSPPVIKKSEASKIVSPNEMLSEVRLTAEDPMNNNKTAKCFLGFFSDFRNSFCMERSSDQIIKAKDDDEKEKENEILLFKPMTPSNPEVQGDQQQNSPTALILKFRDMSNVPPVPKLNKIFSKFGPLDESETELMKKSKRAKIIFKRRRDAETAFSSSGKFRIFGPALISYLLTPQKNLTLQKNLTPQKNCPSTKRSKKAAP